MTQFDFILIWASLFWAVLFIILWMSKLIKFYIGLLIGLLICILINLKLNNLALSWVTNNAFEVFLSNNRDYFANIALAAIPFMGFVFLLNRSFIIQESEQSAWGIISLVWKFLMWLSLFPLALWMYSIVWSLWLSTSWFLSGLLDAFKNSFILSLIWKYGQYIFYLLLALLLYKFVLKFLFNLLVLFFNKIRELRAEEREIRRRQKEENSEEGDGEEHNGH
jgi:hypothetical protein